MIAHMVGLQRLQVGSGTLLGFFQIVQDHAGGLDGTRHIMAAKAFQGTAREELQQHLAGAVFGRGPIRQTVDNPPLQGRLQGVDQAISGSALGNQDFGRIPGDDFTGGTDRIWKFGDPEFSGCNIDISNAVTHSPEGISAIR